MGQPMRIKNKQPLRVLIADDSATARRHLCDVISEMPEMTVIGVAKDGEEAIHMTSELKPDVVSMDIRMPHIDGLEATRRIMQDCPTPVVVVSGVIESDIDLAFQAIDAGALAVVEKPPDRRDPTFADKQTQLFKTLMAMAQVSVVRRGRHMTSDAQKRTAYAVRDLVAKPEIVVIGASAGGPSALSYILATIPADLPVPIVIAQHIPHEFVAGLARWLDKVGMVRVVVVEDNQRLEAGVVHLSPGNAHVTVERVHNQLYARLIHNQMEERHQPSVNVLFRSVAAVCGAHAIGIILTGMGDDGAEGLLAMRQAGARTLAQNRDTATVYGMPGAAVAIGAVQKVVSLTDIPSAILKLL
ncbi:MAG: chemotaxis response regulator protein-glutamate methylesterase [Phototrophicales bacterium]|nr:MAG: chemotaxis response regulator protein-glutamate methylesterase [Phototrophicales bacterium]RMG71413.1 MAG: chemotaxis-specific protein-glutamate methyltransferase CheB [Chloroflexota bacterium]